MKKIFLALFAIILLSGCSTALVNMQVISHLLHVSDTLLSSDLEREGDIVYEGYAFDAIINDMPVIEMISLTAQQQKYLKSYHDKDEVKWRVLKAVKSPLTINIKGQSIKEHSIGQLDSADYSVSLIALNDVKINVEEVLVKSPNVIVNGAPLVSTKYRIVDEILPAGNYIMKWTVYGSENWDRKTIYMTIDNELKSSASFNAITDEQKIYLEYLN